MHNFAKPKRTYEAGRRLKPQTQAATADLPESFQNESQILSSFVKLCLMELGSEVRSIVLFGSRATGRATAKSDYDIAVFVPSKDAAAIFLSRASDLAYPFLTRGIAIHPVVLDVARLGENTHFLNHIRAVGKTLYSAT